LDQSLGYLSQYYFFQTRDGDTGGQINGLLEKKAPVLIFGSSRAEGHYIPSILSNAFGMQVFNAGFKGSNSIYDFGLEQLVFDTYKPELVVYDIASITINKTKFNPYDRLEPLYPFWGNEHVFELIKKKSTLEEYFFLSRLYPYNSKIHSILLFNLLKSRPNVDNGYRPQNTIMKDVPLEDASQDSWKTDELLVSYLKKFIASAKKNNVKIVVVFSPRFYKSKGLPKEIEQFLNENNILYLDFDLESYPKFTDSKLYRDKYHLNHNGAKLFSQLLGNMLTPVLR